MRYLVMVLLMMVGSVLAYSGNGTVGDPYLLTNATDWMVFDGTTADWASGKYVKVTANIDLTGQSITKIGNDSVQYAGDFNGNGKTITAPSIDGTGTSWVGLFGWVKYPAHIYDLGVVNSTMTGDTCVGGFVGLNGGVNHDLVGGSIERCYVLGGTVTGLATTAGGFVGVNTGTIENCYTTAIVNSVAQSGGFVGQCGTVSAKLRLAGYIYNCWSSGAVTVSGNYNAGFVGVSKNNSVLDRCYATGAVTVGVNGNGGAGFGGYILDGTVITHCYATGNVTCAGAVGSDCNIGGFIAWSNGALVEYCYSTGNVTGPQAEEAYDVYAGGFCGEQDQGIDYKNVIRNCWSSGNVDVHVTGSAIDDSVFLGGFIGITYRRVYTCYSIGTVTGSGVGGDYKGGFCGYAPNNVLTVLSDCYWDTTTSGTADGIGYDGAAATKDVTGKTTAEMKTVATFSSDFNTTSVWYLSAGSYPALKYMKGVGLAY